jgi:septal ring factor EnvC (AmiA/AmiB activator)
MMQHSYMLSLSCLWHPAAIDQSWCADASSLVRHTPLKGAAVGGVVTKLRYLFPSCRAAASTAAKQQAQDELRDSQAQASKLQSRLETAQEAAQQAKQQVWQLEQSNTQLAQQAAKQAAESDFLEGELAGLRESEVRLREQVAVQQEQVRSAGPCQHW